MSFEFKVKLLRCGLRGLPCPLFDVVVVVVVVVVELVFAVNLRGTYQYKVHNF